MIKKRIWNNHIFNLIRTKCLHLINEHVNNKTKERNFTIISRSIKSITSKEKHLNQNALWEIIKKTKSKSTKEINVSMKNERGEEVATTADENKHIFQNHYHQLLTRVSPQNENEIRTEELTQQISYSIKVLGTHCKREEINEDEVLQLCKTLKKGKAYDVQGWKNEYLKYGGKDLKNSITIIFNNLTKF